eukprot:CAMPEP_0171327460 /NCGR_PEP_ID=MMETSP0816-20121228/118105_1 /TAXON_ID=420281 /ORGANISM="Proboscia inermis, Strain CCAP1064/1" /LENGTH=135 /DNA_ID=CAMNT_0011827211 /DNA_START=211 /DNA_END=619 /DNA_ORIENTATION=-
MTCDDATARLVLSEEDGEISNQGTPGVGSDHSMNDGDDATARLVLSEEKEGSNQGAVGVSSDHSMVCINPKRRQLRIIEAKSNANTPSAVAANTARHVITSGSRGIGAVATHNSLDLFDLEDDEEEEDDDDEEEE